jgi:glycosyltransferase involved in cell wall biosynthesis
MRVTFLQRIFAHYQWGLVQELAERGEHEYSFLGDTRDPYRSGIDVIAKDRLQEVSFTPVRTWQVGRRIAFQPAAVRVALIDSYDVLILEGSFAHPTAWAAMKAAQRRGKRVLLYTHGWPRQSEPAWSNAVRTRFLQSADGLLLYGRRARAIGLARGVPAEKMHVVFNCLDHRQIRACRSGISDAALAGFRSAAFGDPHLPIVAYLGRVRKEKGLELVLGALARLKARGMQLGFLVIGDGPAAADLRQLSERLGIRTHFSGLVYEEQKLAVMLSASRVVVAPEAVGLAAVHAMSYGTPVVSHNNFDDQRPEAEAIIRGVTGQLFVQGDENDLAEKLSRFLGRDDHRTLWARPCIDLIDRYYNPESMRRRFDRAVSGLPAVESDALTEHPPKSAMYG